MVKFLMKYLISKDKPYISNEELRYRANYFSNVSNTMIGAIVAIFSVGMAFRAAHISDDVIKFNINDASVFICDILLTMLLMIFLSFIFYMIGRDCSRKIKDHNNNE